MTKTIIKTCSCGKEHTEIPETARFTDDDGFQYLTGYWWDCACGSTLFHPLHVDPPFQIAEAA